MRLLHSVLALLLNFSVSALAADANAWKSRTIYFAVTDRIARNAGDNGGSSCGNLGNYCGGTFQGLQSKLDYIKGMGFNAIWITPVITNTDGGYHGYWAQDISTINSHFGSANDLKSLVSAAHSKGIYIMVDVVANHMGQASIPDHQPSPLNQQSSYHPQCNIDYNNQSSVENCWIDGLPDLDTQSSTIRTLYHNWISNLVQTYSFDGVRIDTVKHVEQDYWPGFVNASGVYCIGEVFDGDPNYLAPYAKLMPGLLNYAIYYPMTRFYLQQGSSQDMVNMHNTIGSLFPDPSALGTFIDNHDNPRFLSQKNDASLLKNALTYTILSRGIPIVYYGTEQAFSGGNDPANREDLWRSGFNTKADIYTFVSKLTYTKNVAGSGLSVDDHKHLYVASTAYAWSRAGGKVIALTTNSGQGSSAQHCFGTNVPNGSWNDVFSGTAYKADGNGQLCLNVSNGLPIVMTSS